MPRWMYRLAALFRSLVRRKQTEADFEEEIRFHLDQAAKTQGDNESRRAFGKLTSIKEQTRDAWGWTVLLAMLQDLRFAWRGLRKNPGFALVAVLTLAVGVGSTTALYTIVDSVLLRPLGYRDSGGLLTIWQHLAVAPEPVGPNPKFAFAFRDRSTTLTDVALAQSGVGGLSVNGGRPVVAGRVRATPNLFDLLGVEPYLGSLFRPDHWRSGADEIAVLTYDVWQKVFQADPSVIGKTIRINGRAKEVIGVLPPTFVYPNGNVLRSYLGEQSPGAMPQPAVFLAEAVDASNGSWFGDFGNWVAIARMKPGVTLAQAQADLERTLANVVGEIPPNQPAPPGLQVSAKPLQEVMVQESKQGLWVLMAAVSGLLLTACFNLANMQFARSLSRLREISLREALGAPRWRLVWHALSESVLLAAAGGALGVAFAAAALSVLRRQALVDLPRLPEIAIDAHVLAVAFGTVVGSVLLFGLLPALRAAQIQPNSQLQIDNGRAHGHRAARRLQRWLVAAQAGGAVTLLLVTALFARSLFWLTDQDKGFDTDRVAFANVNLNGPAYGDAARRTAFTDNVLNAIRTTSGIEAAGAVSAMPLEGETWMDGVQRPDGGQEVMSNLRWCTPGYFETNGHRLRAGRFFDATDAGRLSMVVSENVAAKLWPGENPVGRRARIQQKDWTVVGVVADSRNASLKAAPPQVVYLPYTYARFTPIVFTARGALPASSIAQTLRETVWRFDPETTIVKFGTMDAQVSASLSSERFQTFLLIAFGGVALFLAMLGIYGVLSYTVATRKQEIGVRMALGATRDRIYGMTLSELGWPIASGIAGGLFASAALAKWIGAMLYGAKEVSLSVVAGVTILFLLCALVAAMLPARRAARTDPIEALRVD